MTEKYGSIGLRQPAENHFDGPIAGITTSVRIVDETMPLIIGAAIRPMTLAPAPLNPDRSPTGIRPGYEGTPDKRCG